jgi:hypothetical protein
MKSQAPLKIMGKMAMAVLLSLMISCSGIQKKKRLPPCKAVLDMIEKCWRNDVTPGLHHFKADGTFDPELNILDNQDCFQSLEIKDIEKLFGNPNTQQQGSMVYYLSEPCLQKEGMNANGCHYMLFKLKADETVKEIWFLTHAFEY